jgi:hypothetical protein
MSIADGFNLWLGKILAEALIPAIILAVILVGYLMMLVQDWAAKRKRKP